MGSIRRWIAVLIAVMLTVMAGGCAKTDPSDQETGGVQPQDGPEKEYTLGVYQDGFAVLSGNGMHTIYLDEDHSYRPLCLKADCSHQLDDKTCQAVLLAEESGGLVRYHEGFLWFIPFNLGGDSYLFQADLWGENVKQIRKVMPGIGYTSPNLFRNGKMLRVVWNFTQDENLMPSGVDAWITEIDLATGEESVIVGPVHGRNSRLYLTGAYGDFVYYKLNDESEPGERPKAVLIAQNIITGEQHTIIENANEQQICGLCQQWLYVKAKEKERYELWQYDLNDDTWKALKMPEGADAFAEFDVYRMEDHLLLKNERGEWWRYDPGQETMELFRSDLAGDAFSPEYQTETGYLGIVTSFGTETEPVRQEYAFLSFEDFKSGKEPLLLSHHDKKPLSVQ